MSKEANQIGGNYADKVRLNSNDTNKSKGHFKRYVTLVNKLINMAPMEIISTYHKEGCIDDNKCQFEI